MKIAVITEDGKTISRHFGRAPYYQVITIEDGKIVQRAMRPKPGHDQFAGEHTQAEHHGEHHGFGPAAHGRHARMAEVIADCQVLLCGGMGAGAYEGLRALKLQPLLTEISDIDEAVQAYLDGKLVDRTDLLH